ncbi:hypothetical protein AVEN_264366-1 [Araneus ventricosus]|uniref:Uncharacterized protein n=1 Tax=Araneus ventricosus TaxID=182803 RepID=A0A4Y2H7Z4_ARAVE|nr:hypothetical protein AVEN_264366-1 [Araneus ventricosus]
MWGSPTSGDARFLFPTLATLYSKKAVRRGERETKPGTSVENKPSTNQEPSCKTPKSIPARYYEGCPPRKRRKLTNTGEDVIKTVTSALKARSDQESGMVLHKGKLVENATRKLSPLVAKDFMQKIFSVVTEFGSMEEETFFK